MQNTDGGFGTYEGARGSKWLEVLNPANVFDRIMVEYSYPGCTTAVLTAVSVFAQHFPDHRVEEVTKLKNRALKVHKTCATR